MAFCEECGAKLEPGVRFCEECGTPVPGAGGADSIPSSGMSGLDVFSGDDWQSQWTAFAENARGGEIGIILTRQAELLSQVDMDEDGFAALISDYIDNRREHGVAYAYLDLQTFRGGSRSSPDATVKALRLVCQVAKPKYLFILGNEDVIDVIRWDNDARDDDADVPSDLCYSTLDTNSPWKGQTYDFDETVRVGRLPTYPGESSESFIAYFENAMRLSGRLGAATPYGVSALVWEDETNDEYGAVSSEGHRKRPRQTT